ncbi:GrpB family protein, partial [Enterococcus faecalis]|uniref:GrpB family protein n=1 Tax=Enterococcus faecalis TaxID=1351 RepID=UPI003D6B38F1
AYVPALKSVGFALRVREPEHRMLRTPDRDVHLHVYEPRALAIRDYLDLRDWLRVDAADREYYAVEKRRLARQQWRDMNAYADAK